MNPEKKTFFFQQSSKFRKSRKKETTSSHNNLKEANLKLFWNYVNETYFKNIQRIDLDSIEFFLPEKKQPQGFFFFKKKFKIWSFLHM